MPCCLGTRLLQELSLFLADLRYVAPAGRAFIHGSGHSEGVPGVQPRRVQHADDF